MRHPDDRRIALYACGDAGWFERLSTARHVAQCDSCRERAKSFRQDREAFRRQAPELPDDLDWNSLAGEMTANIHLGLNAGECVSEVRAKRTQQSGWRPLIAAAGLAMVVMSALYLNFPAEQKQSLARGMNRLWSGPAVRIDESGVALAATRNGIEVRENGAALTMVNPGEAPSVVVMNTSGSLRARYVDSDTGQVTITNVYAQ